MIRYSIPSGPSTGIETDSAETERESTMKQSVDGGGMDPRRLRFTQCAIIVLAAFVTLAAWRYSKLTLDAQDAARFDRQAEQVVELLQVRMKNYADALWGSVAMIRACDGKLDRDRWQAFADCLHIERKYPGINGIGIVHALSKDEIPPYLAEQRKSKPDFRIHPPLDHDYCFPVSYMVPEQGNVEAIGLDMAHESNRFTAATQSRDSGQAHVTGPISLVQDDGHTPGFLFFAPFYNGGPYETVEQRREHFSGLVVAPFVAKKLLHGVLERKKRHVRIRLSDDDGVLYDEHIATVAGYDPNPKFRRTQKISLYGRCWTFDIRSTKSFCDSSSTSQPLLILIGGITIDALLIYLFISMHRSSQRILSYAAQLQESQQQTEERALQLEHSNAQLEQFAFVASHDLQEPLRKVASFCELLRDECAAQLSEDGKRYAEFAIDGATRMRLLIQDLLTFSRVGNEPNRTELTDTKEALSEALENLTAAIEESKATITHDPMPKLFVHSREMVQLFQNLIGNSINYRSDEAPYIHVGVTSDDRQWKITVTDNGKGIAPEYREQVFGIFKRLDNRSNSSGTGIGLAICKRIVEQMGGKIWFEPNVGSGCTVCLTINKTAGETPGIPADGYAHA